MGVDLKEIYDSGGDVFGSIYVHEDSDAWRLLQTIRDCRTKYDIFDAPFYFDPGE